MACAERVDQILPDVYRWNAFSSQHRCDLSSHAIRSGFNLVLFDPIGVSAEILDWFPSTPPTVIFLTNANHLRASLEWRERFDVPIFCPPNSGISERGVETLQNNVLPVPAWEFVPLNGGGPGEIAFRLPSLSLVVFGDALVNLPGRALELLPEKYCSDQRQLRHAMENLVKIPFENALMAHGEPLIGDAWKKIQRMLG